MVKPLKLETTKSGIEICSGKPKLIIVGNWYALDEDTGFITQKSIDGVLSVIAKKLIDMKFTIAKPDEQSIMINGDTMIITQSLRAKGKLMKKQDADMSARAIMEQYFKHATATGYFDQVDPEKLQKNIDKPDSKEMH